MPPQYLRTQASFWSIDGPGVAKAPHKQAFREQRVADIVLPQDRRVGINIFQRVADIVSPQGGNPGRDARTSGPRFRQPAQQYSPALRTRTRTTSQITNRTSQSPRRECVFPQPQVTRQASRLGGARESKRGFEAALCEATC